MKRFIVGLAVLLLTVGGANATISTFTAIDDWGNSDGSSDLWSYICQKSEYEAFFKFDLSSLPNDTVINSATFSPYIDYSQPAERTVWQGGTMLSAFAPTDESWANFSLTNLVLGDEITLMLTGPSNGDHICGVVNLIEGGYAATLTLDYGTANGVAVPEPATLLLLGAGLIGLAGYGRKKLN